VPGIDFSNFASNKSWGYLTELCSNFIATEELSKISVPSNISPKAPVPIFFPNLYLPPTLISTVRL